MGEKEGRVSMGDMVNSPAHYQSDKIEVIEVIEAFFPDDYLLGNVCKYLLRCNKKHESPIEDLKKAIWYLNRKIETIEKDILKEITEEEICS